MDFGRSLGHQFLIVTSAGMAPAFLFSRLAVRGDRPKKKNPAEHYLGHFLLEESVPAPGVSSWLRSGTSSDLDKFGFGRLSMKTAVIRILSDSSCVCAACIPKAMVTT